MFQILSLSGGGFLGLYTAAILADLEREFAHPIASHFNLLAGTSIGGIVALALAAEVPATEIQDAFEKNGKLIFGDRLPPRTSLLALLDVGRKFFKAKFDAGALRSTVEDIVGSDTRLGDLKHPVIVPAVNLSRGAPQLFKTAHHESFRLDLELKVSDVAMATSAAPTFFPLASIGDCQYADGGLYANSPDLLALHEAIHFFGEREESIRLLSIGTTTAKFSFAHADRARFGIFQWFRGARLLNVIIASQQRSVDFMLRHRLADRYVRLDQDQSKEQERVLGLDSATDKAKQTIQALARGTFQEAVSRPVLRDMLATIAPAPKFFHKLKPR